MRNTKPANDCPPVQWKISITEREPPASPGWDASAERDGEVVETDGLTFAIAFDRIRALIGIGRASDPSGTALHGPPRRDLDHTRALPFSASMIAAVTADRDARLARWAADPDRGWTIRTVRPPEIRLRHWRHRSAIQNWKAMGERYGQRVEAEGLTEAIAVRALRQNLGLPVEPDAKTA